MPRGLRHDIYQNQKLPGDRFVALIECDLRPKFTSPNCSCNKARKSSELICHFARGFREHMQPEVRMAVALERRGERVAAPNSMIEVRGHHDDFS